MEKFNPQEHRNDLAEALKSFRADDKEKAQEKLSEAQGTQEYQISKKIHDKYRLEKLSDNQLSEMVTNEDLSKESKIMLDMERGKAQGALIDYAQIPFEEFEDGDKESVKTIVDEYFKLFSGGDIGYGVNVSYATNAFRGAKNFIKEIGGDKGTIKFISDILAEKFLDKEIYKRGEHVKLSKYDRSSAHMEVGSMYHEVGELQSSIKSYNNARSGMFENARWTASIDKDQDRVFGEYKNKLNSGEIKENPIIEEDLDVRIRQFKNDMENMMWALQKISNKSDRHWKIKRVLTKTKILTDTLSLDIETRDSLINSVVELAHEIQQREDTEANTVSLKSVELLSYLGNKMEYNLELPRYLEKAIQELEDPDNPKSVKWAVDNKHRIFVNPNKIIRLREEKLLLLQENLKYVEGGGVDNEQLNKPITWQLQEMEIRSSKNLIEDIGIASSSAIPSSFSSPYGLGSLKFNDKEFDLDLRLGYRNELDDKKIALLESFVESFDGSPIKVSFFAREDEPHRADEFLGGDPQKEIPPITVEIKEDGTYSYDGDNSHVNRLSCILAEHLKRSS